MRPFVGHFHSFHLKTKEIDRQGEREREESSKSCKVECTEN